MKCKIAMYVSGSCKTTAPKGIGGWSFVLQDASGRTMENAGWTGDTSLHAMELQACIEGVRKLKKPCEVQVVSRSAYLAQTAMGMAHIRERGWKTASGTPLKNVEAWRELIRLCQQGGHHLSFTSEGEMTIVDQCRKASCKIMKEGVACTTA